jgi:hypothetical protein
MTDMTALCPGCGRKMIHKIEGSVQGMFCEQCGWNAVTTYTAPIRADMTVYSIYADGISNPSRGQIRMLSRAACLNYLEIKRQLAKGSFLVYEGDAENVLRIIGDLDAYHIGYKIIPPFPYQA